LAHDVADFPSLHVLHSRQGKPSATLAERRLDVGEGDLVRKVLHHERHGARAVGLQDSLGSADRFWLHVTDLRALNSDALPRQRKDAYPFEGGSEVTVERNDSSPGVRIDYFQQTFCLCVEKGACRDNCSDATGGREVDFTLLTRPHLPVLQQQNSICPQDTARNLSGPTWFRIWVLELEV